MRMLRDKKALAAYVSGLQSNALEFENDLVLYLDYDAPSNTLRLNDVTNVGLRAMYTWKYDFEQTFEDNLLAFTEKLHEKHGLTLDL